MGFEVDMKSKSRQIIEYLYRHKLDNQFKSASLVEIPNTEGVDALYGNGYINIEFTRDQTIKGIYITGKGIDWAEANIQNDTAVSVSQANIENDVIALKIRSELYGHIEGYLRNEDYYHAVEESYKFVRLRLKELTGSEKATQAFGYDANNQVDFVKVFGHEPADEVETDFFKGVRFLHLAVQFLRNEKMHSLATSLDRNLALHYISLASLAYDLVSRPTTSKRD